MLLTTAARTIIWCRLGLDLVAVRKSLPPFSNSSAQVVTSSFAELSLNAEPAHTVTSTVNAELEDTGEKLEVEPILSVVPRVYPWPDQTPTAVLQRLYELGDVTWSTATVSTMLGNQPALATFVPFQLLQAKDLNMQAISFFCYFRADLEIHFRLNSNQFYSGCLMFTAFPGNPSTATDCQYVTTGRARCWMKPKFMSAQTQDTIILRLPWVDPHRFGPVPLPTNYVTWTVSVDILTQLRTASINVPDTLNLMVHARFVAPQLLVPYDGGQVRAGDFVRQTDHRGMPITTYQGGHPTPRKVKIHRVVRSSDPVESGRRPPAPKYRILPTSVTSTITECGTFIRAVVEQLQPVAKLAVFLAALFDKPNLDSVPMRVINQSGINMSQADHADQSMPLTLYQTSYLGVDPEILPDGKAWTFRDIAMTPGLSDQLTFSALTDALTIACPTGDSGTPFSFAASMFQHARGSCRIRLSFYCSAFLSARFIIVFVPFGATGTLVPDIDNNLCRLVDVRGDTTVDFTVPWTCPYDFLPTESLVTGTIVVKLYDPIASVDTTTDPAIDVVAWIAAGPDVQFNNPVSTTMDTFHWPGAFQKQADLHADFQNEFPSFLNGCTYLVDNHYCVSESAEYVTDVLKRYCTYEYVQGHPGELLLEYTPATNSVQALLLSAFRFYRGGTMYKLITPRTPPAGVSQASSGTISVQLGLGFGDVPASFVSTGNSHIVSTSQDDVLDVTVPWNWVLPYASRTLFSPTIGDPLFDGTWGQSGTGYSATVFSTNVQNHYVYTAVRDDFLLGMLQPPIARVAPTKTSRKPKISAEFLERMKRPLPRHKIEDFQFISPTKSSSKQSPAPAKAGLFSRITSVK